MKPRFKAGDLMNDPAGGDGRIFLIVGYQPDYYVHIKHSHECFAVYQVILQDTVVCYAVGYVDEHCKKL